MSVIKCQEDLYPLALEQPVINAQRFDILDTRVAATA